MQETLSGTTPTVSVIMAVHNAERYVAEAVESILGQTWRDFEFIIIDDGSTDDSLPILRTYSSADDRIRLVPQRHAGLPKALNRAIALAHGQFLARMDADDISVAERFEKQVAFLSRNDHVVCISSGCQRIDETGRTIGMHINPSDGPTVERLLYECHCPIVHPAAMMRTAAVQKVGGYNERWDVAQDVELWLRLVEIGQLCNLPECLLKYRVHSLSQTGRKLAEQKRRHLEACEIAWRRLDRRGNVGPDKEFRRRCRLRVIRYLLHAGQRAEAMKTLLRYAPGLALRDCAREMARCILPKPVFATAYRWARRMGRRPIP